MTYLLCSHCQRRLRAPWVTVYGAWKGKAGVKHLCSCCAPEQARPGMTYRVTDGAWIAIERGGE